MFFSASDLSPEVLEEILWLLDPTSLIQLMSTNRMLFNIVQQLQLKWKRLCEEDFDVCLKDQGKFYSYYEIYKLLYCSRILIGSYTYARYFDNLKNTQLPNWLLYWAALSQEAPRMKYGLDRIKRRVKGHYLRRLNDISYGQIRKVFDMTPYDLMNLYPTRVQRGTIYFSYATVRYAGIRKYGCVEDYIRFLLTKCFRSRGYVLRNYDKIKHSNPLNPL